jgi:hypothetical protein
MSSSNRRRMRMRLSRVLRKQIAAKIKKTRPLSFRIFMGRFRIESVSSY